MNNKILKTSLFSEELEKKLNLFVIKVPAFFWKLMLAFSVFSSSKLLTTSRRINRKNSLLMMIVVSPFCWTISEVIFWLVCKLIKKRIEKSRMLKTLYDSREKRIFFYLIFLIPVTFSLIIPLKIIGVPIKLSGLLKAIKSLETTVVSYGREKV